jgi:hypothetical protein
MPRSSSGYYEAKIVRWCVSHDHNDGQNNRKENEKSQKNKIQHGTEPNRLPKYLYLQIILKGLPLFAEWSI